MGETLDFNRTVMKEAKASDAINAQLDAMLTKKRAGQARREYVGASGIGGSCERAIQFEFAGAPREKDFPPATLRKFDIGHHFEELSRFWFTDAGFKLVQHNQRTGALYGFSQLDGAFKGHPDGVFIDGPDVLKYPALWEHKAVGAKTFREIDKHGLKKARPTYYAQVAIYQAYLGLTENPAVFTITNTDGGEQLHLSIPFDAEEAQRASDRAVRIVNATRAGDLLPRPFASADYFECKFCAFAGRCWGMAS
jgi:hypothetical protein